MDYMNQYTFAKTTAEMISEIGYTEIITLISTAISVPATVLGSYGVKGVAQYLSKSSVIVSKAALKTALKEIAVQTIKSTVKEVFEEIVYDSLIEALAENVVSMAGGTVALGFWISASATSARETASGPGINAMKQSDSSIFMEDIIQSDKELQAWYALEYAKNGEGMTEAEFQKENRKKIDEMIAKKLELKSRYLKQRLNIKNSIASHKLKIVAYGSAFLFGGFIGYSAIQTMKSYSKVSIGDIKALAKYKVYAEERKREKANLISIASKIWNSPLRPVIDAKESAQVKDSFQKKFGNSPVSTRTLINLKNPMVSTNPVDAQVYEKMGEGRYYLSENDNKPKIMDDVGKKGNIERNLDTLSLLKARSPLSAKAWGGMPAGMFFISLEGLKRDQRAIFDEDIKGWNKISKTFQIPDFDGATLTIQGAIDAVKNGFGIDRDVTLRFYSAEYGVLSQGDKINSPLTGQEIEIDYATTLYRDIHMIPGLTLVFNVPRQRALASFKGYQKIRQKFAYYIAGELAFDEMCSSIDDAIIMDNLYDFINSLAVEHLTEQGVFINSKLNPVRLRNGYWSFHDSLYLSEEFKNEIMSSDNDAENERRWSNWIKTSDMICEITGEMKLDATEYATLEKWTVERAEFAILDLILRDYIQLHKAPENGGPNIYTVMDRIDGLLMDESLISEIRKTFLKDDGNRLFWYKFIEAFFDDTRSPSLTIQRYSMMYHGRIGEANDYMGKLRYRILKDFISSGYNPPEVVIDGTNFGTGDRLYGNSYINERDMTLNEIEKSLILIDTSSFSNLLPSSRRFYDNNLIIWWNAYSAQPTKNTINPNGISTQQETELAHDSASIQTHTAFFEISRGVTQLHEIKEFRLTLVAPPRKGDSLLTLSSVISKISHKDKFKDYGKSDSLKMPSELTYLFTVSEALNWELLSTLQNAKNKKDAVSLVYNFMKDPQNREKLNTIFKSKAQDAYSRERFNDLENSDYKIYTLELFANIKNIQTLIQKDPNTGKYKISLEEQIDLLFPDTTNRKLVFEDLPDSFTVVDDDIVPFTKEMFNQFKNEKKPLLVVHDSTNRFIVIPAELFNKLPDGVSEGLKYRNKIYYNVYLCDSEYTLLVGKVYLEDGQIIVQERGWQSTFTELDEQSQRPEILYYFALGISSGSQQFCFLQKTSATISPYAPHQRLLPKITRTSIKMLLEDLPPPSIKNHISQETAEDIMFLLPVIYEIVHSLKMGLRETSQSDIAHRYLSVSDWLFSLHNEEINIKRITEVLKVLEPLVGEDFYSKDNPESWLKQITQFSVKEDGITLEYNDLNSYKLRNNILKLLQNVHDRGPTDSSYQLIENILGKELFDYLSTISFQGEQYNALIVDKALNLDETVLIEHVDKAMERLFGYIGVLFIKQGLLTFNKEDGHYVIIPMTHSNHDLYKYASRFQLRPLIKGDTKANLHFDIYRFEERLEEQLISMFLSGHQERITTVDMNGLINSEFYFSKTLVFRSPFLHGLYDNIIDGRIKTTYHQAIKNIFLSWFYGTNRFPRYNSEMKLIEMFIEGREIIKAKIQESLMQQVTLSDIKNYFKDEIDTMYEFAGKKISWEMCAKIKRLQIIEYMTRIYGQGIYYPREHPAPSKEARGVRSMGDIAFHIRGILRNPNQEFASIPFAPYGGIPQNEFFKKFSLELRLDYFSKEELGMIIPTLSYNAYHKILPKEGNRFNAKEIDLYDINIFMPELKEQIQVLHNTLKFYFANYIGGTGVNEFAVKFYLPKPNGFHKYNSLLHQAIGANFRKTPEGTIHEELNGEFLEFEISNDADLEKMVSNIIYYMIKYDCVAAINEGKAVKDDNIANTKYALILSPSRLYTADYLLISYSPRSSFNIQHDGLSDTAIELYQSLLGVDMLAIYRDKQVNHYSNIWSESSRLSPYIMINVYLLKEYMINTYGEGNVNYIENLKERQEYRK